MSFFKSDIFRFLISIIVSLFVVLILASLNNVDILSVILTLNPFYIGIGFAIFFIGYIIDALRMMLVSSQFEKSISFFPALFNNISGYFFCSLTPFQMGGQPYQIFHMTQHGIDSHHATNLMISRFLQTMFLCIAISLISYAFIIQELQNSFISTNMINIGFLVSIIISVLFLIAFIRNKWLIHFAQILDKIPFFRRKAMKTTTKKWVETLNESIKFLWQEKLLIMLFDTFLGVITLVVQSMCIYFFLVVYTNIDFSFLSFLKIFGSVILLNMVVYYIPTPGASGGIEFSYLHLFGTLTDNHSATFLAVIGWRLSSYYLQIILGYIIVIIRRFIIKKK